MVVGLLFTLVPLGIGVLLTLVALTYLRAFVDISRTDITAIADVNGRMEEVAVSGTARPLVEPTPARFADVDAIITDWKLAERRGSGDNSYWSTLQSGRHVDPFLVDDGTGRMVVDPEGAEWMFEEHGETFDGDDPPAVVRELLAETGETGEGSTSSRKRKWEESRLDVGEDVFVYGPIKPDTAVNASEATAQVAVGTDRTADEGMTEKTTMRLTPGILPFVGDPNETLSLGGAEEGTLFTVADSPARTSGRRYLKKGGIVLLFALFFGGLGVFMLLQMF